MVAEEDGDMEVPAEGEEPETPRGPVATKKEAPNAGKVASKLVGVKTVDIGLKDHELFAERKRTETTFRDTACKAICKIKYSLRQPGAQEDGKPVVPENWDANYKPVLGSYIKFLLSRPDQFKIIEGSGPGFYTVQDVTRGKTVVAPAKGVEKGSGKGKEKGTGKGKGKVKGKDGKGKGKKGFKGYKGKDWGKGWGKAPDDGPRDFATLKGRSKGKAPPVYRAPDNEDVPLTAAEKLLMQAARQALSADGQPNDEELKEEELEAAEDAIGYDDEGFGEEGGVEEYGGEEEVQMEAGAATPVGKEEEPEGSAEAGVEDVAAEAAAEEAAAAADAEEEDDANEIQAPAGRLSYFDLLFEGGLGTKRGGSALGGAAKRAR